MNRTNANGKQLFTLTGLLDCHTTLLQHRHCQLLTMNLMKQSTRFTNTIFTVRNCNTRRAIIDRCLSTSTSRLASDYQTEKVSRAWQIGHYGKNDQLKLTEREVPLLTRPNQVLIKVHAASINPIDIRSRGGYGATLLNKARGVKSGDEFPLTLGRDCSGVILAVGKGVKDFKNGDQVWASINAKNAGCHAQHVVATEGELSHKPESLSHVEAASIPYVATTNWSAVYAVAKLRPEKTSGKRVLIFGGTGGVGTFGIQLLNAWGANVTVTCSPDAFDLVQELGAHQAIDYRSPDIERELLKHGKYDFILNAVGDSMEDIATMVIKEKSNAQYVTLITPFFTEIEKKGVLLGGLSSSMELFRRSRKFYSAGATFRWAFAQPNSYALKEVGKLVDDGKVRPVIDQVFGFDELPKAFEKVEEGHSRGKVVVEVCSSESSPDESDGQLLQFFDDKKM